MPNQEYLTLQEVCNMLKISRGTAYYWLKVGLLKPEFRVRRVMRFDKAKVVKSLKIEEGENGELSLNHEGMAKLEQSSGERTPGRKD